MTFYQRLMRWQRAEPGRKVSVCRHPDLGWLAYAGTGDVRTDVVRFARTREAASERCYRATLLRGAKEVKP